MNTFTFDGNVYTYINFKELKIQDLPDSDIYGRSKYLSLNCAFDIETSKDEIEKKSWMYVWQFAINDITVIGRTWPEFLDLLKMLQEKYDTNNKKRIICWVHNLSYEWQWIKNIVQWNYDTYHKCWDIFAKDQRNIIKAVSSHFIEFRDSLAITNKPLDKVAKDYKVGIEKLKDSFNYDLCLTSQTPLKLCQIAYCINDVQILARWHQTYIKREFMKQGIQIPMTSTAIVRNELKREFKKLPKKERTYWKNRISQAFPTEKDYKDLMRWVYRGGLVHSNKALALVQFTNKDMAGVDFKSSYPAVLLHNKYPFWFVRRDPEWFYKFKDNRKVLEIKAFYGCFTFTNIKARTPHTLESKSKIMKAENALYDNGRLASADKIVVCLTEQDWLNYQDFYMWDSITCHSLRVAHKYELPKYFLDMILKYFELKETLPKDSIDYGLTKAKLNSLYGMACTSLYNMKLSFNQNTGLFDEEEDNKSWDEIKKGQILLPYFGIWCSAYARRNLAHALVKVGWYDAFYNDTDSCKLRNYHANKYVFDAWNDKMERINKTMYVGDHDRKHYLDIGKWDFEGKLFKLKVAGAKRYVYTQAKKDKDNMYHLHDEVVVAGMKKGTMQNYCKENGLNLYDEFMDGLYLDEKHSKKLTSNYCDTAFKLVVTDYLGRSAAVAEKSCVTLLPQPFELSITKDYLALVSLILQRNNMRIGDRL